MPILFGSCSEEFLDRAPEDAITVDNFYNNIEEVRQSTAFMYTIPWFDYNDKCYFSVGDGTAGIFLSNDGAMNSFYQFSLSSTHARLNEAWRSMYVVVAQSNDKIAAIKTKVPETVTDDEKNAAIAECRFMRGVAYSYLGMLFGAVPIIVNNADLIDEPKVPRNNLEDVFQFVVNDLEFAAENLPETDDPGRVTSWSAKAMLSRIYLYRAGLSGSKDAADITLAQEMAEDVIKNSGSELMENYADLFKIENNNNPESLFALQWISVSNHWGSQNTHNAYFAPSGSLSGVGDGWGGGNGAAPSIQELYDPSDARRKATFMYKGDHYPELASADGGYTYDEESYAGSAVRKYVTGSSKDAGATITFMHTPLNTYMMRLAEVYLIYAETFMGTGNSTDNTEALKYYNMVRNRAGLDDDADGILTWNELFNEKRIELAMEGQGWFDIIRWSYFDQSSVLDYLSNQERGHYEWIDGEKSVVTQKFEVEADDLLFPIPEAEIVANPLLAEDPEPYVFAE